MDSMKPSSVSGIDDALGPPLGVCDTERCIDILVGLGVDEAELRKRPEKATSEEPVEA
jgi:hypothetical protein